MVGGGGLETECLGGFGGFWGLEKDLLAGAVVRWMAKNQRTTVLESTMVRIRSREGVGCTFVLDINLNQPQDPALAGT